MKSITTNDPQEIEEILSHCKVCTLSMITDEGLPYAVPMNFYYEDMTVYLHCGPHGAKNRYIELNPQVCITFTVGEKLVHQHADVACSYSMRSDSVQLMGRVEVITDLQEKRDLMNRMMAFYTDRTDFNYSTPALDNVVVWKVSVEKGSTKSLGLTYDEYLGWVQ